MKELDEIEARARAAVTLDGSTFSVDPKAAYATTRTDVPRLCAALREATRELAACADGVRDRHVASLREVAAILRGERGA